MNSLTVAALATVAVAGAGAYAVGHPVPRGPAPAAVAWADPPARHASAPSPRVIPIVANAGPVALATPVSTTAEPPPAEVVPPPVPPGAAPARPKARAGHANAARQARHVHRRVTVRLASADPVPAAAPAAAPPREERSAGGGPVGDILRGLGFVR